MKNNYFTVGAGVWLLFSGLHSKLVQSGSEFLNCSPDPVTLSVDCGKSDFIVISGKVETAYLQPVENVKVTLTSPGLADATYVTGMDGIYNFNLSSPGDYTLYAERNDFYRNGVSTIDLLLIQKHLLGSKLLSNPYDMIAADANNSQSVTAIDLIELRKLILGVYTELPSNKSWRFVAKSVIFTDPLDPWVQDTVHSGTSFGSISFNDINNPGNLDFIGIKIGDVNNTVKANFQSLQKRESRPKVKWLVDQNLFLSHEMIDIHFYLEDARAIQGYQFTIEDPDLEFIGVASESINLTEENFALSGDKITISWFDVEGIINSNHEPVFTLKARAKKSGELKNTLTINSDITEAEMYGMDDEIFEPVLRFAETGIGNSTFLFSPEPNPWKEQTTIPFYLDKAEDIIFEISDMNGRLLYVKEGKYEAGKNRIIITSSDINERGILFYSIKSDFKLLTDKMIVLD